jgi:hypothetical protein
MDLTPLDWPLAGRPLRLWWRDDDAAQLTPQLDRLLALAARLALPLAVAAVPARLSHAARARLLAAPQVTMLVHGFAHENHAPPGEKKTEYGLHRSVPAIRQELAEARRLLPEAAPIFVPPWNRIDRALVPLLPEVGFLGLSTHGAKQLAMGQLAQVNTWVDPIDWRGTRGLLDAAKILAQFSAAAQHGGPVGLLTHHADMNEEMWRFLDDLLLSLVRYPGAHWSTVGDLFTIPA